MPDNLSFHSALLTSRCLSVALKSDIVAFEVVNRKIKQKVKNFGAIIFLESLVVNNFIHKHAS